MEYKQHEKRPRIMEIEQQNNLKLIEAMNTVVMALNDEDAIEPWFYSYPDGADSDELMEIAGDYELMDDLCSNFKRRMNAGADSGWVTQPIEEFLKTPREHHVYGVRK